jgi:SNF family Na+-dependent transporter
VSCRRQLFGFLFFFLLFLAAVTSSLSMLNPASVPGGCYRIDRGASVLLLALSRCWIAFVAG